MEKTQFQQVKDNLKAEDDVRRISLSVIVPCYNVEPFLDRSLRSIERQWNGRTDYEIILVNDASLDNGIQKLNAFKEKYPNNVIVIDKHKNEGVAAARNSGLEMANGEWIVFFDPDDELIDGGYAQILQTIEQEQEEIDILSYGVQIVEKDEIDDPMPSFDFSGIFWRGNSLDFMIHYPFGVCWNMMFHKRIFDGRKFPPLIICEDTVVIVSILLQGLKMAKTDLKIYRYIMHTQSMTQSINSVRMNRACDDIMTAIEVLHKMKLNQRDDVKAKITEKQQLFSVNLITRLMLCTKKTAEICRFRDVMRSFSLFPLTMPGIQNKIYNFFMKHPMVLIISRPLYRLYRILSD